MRNIILVIFLLVVGCSTTDPAPVETYNTYDDYDARTLPRDQYGEQYTQYKEIVKRYEPPQEMAEKKRVIFNRVISARNPVKIAILLPLSGKYEALGNNLLDAAQLALFGINNSNLVLMPIDTKGTSFGALDAANKAIKQEAKLIIGPVFGASAKAISSLAAENNINVISFSNDKKLAGSGVFAIGFLPEQQIRRVVEYAMDIGVEDFTAVLPNSTYGASVAKEVRETVGQNPAASVLKTEIFRVGKTGKALKLSSHVYKAFSSSINTKPPKDYDEELKAYNYNVIKYPRAMIIAEGGSRLRKITGLLGRYRHDKEVLQLLGGAQWHEESFLDNEVLQDSLFAAPPKNRRDSFERSFENIYGYKTNKIGSLAYDAVALVAAVARISGETDFTREQLANPRGFIGVDGIFRLLNSGLTERGLAIMTIKDGQFKIVDAAPNNFFEVKFKKSEEEVQ